MEKHSVSRLSYLFLHLHLLSSDSFSSTLLSSNLSLLSASSLLCFSSVNIVGSLTSKLPSIKTKVKGYLNLKAMKNICSCACYRGRAVLVYNDAVQRCDCAGAEVRSCRCSGAIVQVQWCDCAGAVVRLCRCSGAIVQVQWCDCVCASSCAGAVVRLCMCKYLCKLYIVYNLVCVYTCNLYPTCILLVSYLYIVFFNYWP